MKAAVDRSAAFRDAVRQRVGKSNAANAHREALCRTDATRMPQWSATRTEFAFLEQFVTNAAVRAQTKLRLYRLCLSGTSTAREFLVATCATASLSYLVGYVCDRLPKRLGGRINKANVKSFRSEVCELTADATTRPALELGAQALADLAGFTLCVLHVHRGTPVAPTRFLPDSLSPEEAEVMLPSTAVAVYFNPRHHDAQLRPLDLHVWSASKDGPDKKCCKTCAHSQMPEEYDWPDSKGMLSLYSNWKAYFLQPGNASSSGGGACCAASGSMCPAHVRQEIAMNVTCLVPQEPSVMHLPLGLDMVVGTAAVASAVRSNRTDLVELNDPGCSA